MGRSPCCDKVGLKKGPWTPEEDHKLLAYIQENGHGSWRALPPKAGLQRCGKSCRLRWTNYLRPDIKRGKFSLQEEQTIIQLHALLGNRWSAIATHLPKRTDNEIKNYWNTHLKKRLTKMGIDPLTHKPKSDTCHSSGNGQSKGIANLSHMAQWESARLEAEARLVRESKLRAPSASALAPTIVQLPQQHVLRSWQREWQPKETGGTSQGPQIPIDLQSPTSTLNFLDSTLKPCTGCLPDSNPKIPMFRGQGEGEGDKLEGQAGRDEEVELKRLGKPILFTPATRDHRMMNGSSSTAPQGFSMDDTMYNTVYGTEELWLPETSSIGSRSSRSSRDFGQAAGALSTEMLLDNSDEQNSSERGAAGDSDNAESISCMEQEDEEEEDEDEESNNYWNNILGLLNSSPPSNSPPPVF